MKRTLSRIAILMLALVMVLTSAIGAYASSDSSKSSGSKSSKSSDSSKDSSDEETADEEEDEPQDISEVTGKSEWVKIDGKRYYFGADGNLYTGWHKRRPYKSDTVRWCFFDENGVYIKSIKTNIKSRWVNVDGRRFYFTKKRRPMEHGFNFVHGKLYYMDELGAVVYGKFKAEDGVTYKTHKNGTITGINYYRHKYKAFVIIDISSQFLRFYKNGNLRLNTDVITGLKGRHDTPTGTFKVRSKQRNIYLTGSTWNAFVNYWMAFIGSAYGMHDASWRSSGQFSNHNTYKSNGSHGCVNMRKGAAKKLFGLVKVGTPVIVRK